MTNPTPLSPAAQAVLTAATQRLYCLDPEDVPTSASEHGCAIAAALRAAAVYSYCPMDRQRLATIATELEGVNG